MPLIRPDISRITVTVGNRTSVLGWCLVAFVLLMTFDGALRKWFIPGAEAVVFVIKDVFLAATLFGLLLLGKPRYYGKVPVEISLVMALYFGCAAIGAVNPLLPNLAVGIWGVKSHVLYAALIYLIGNCFSDSRAALQALHRGYGFVVIPVCALALVQSTLPPDHFLNQQLAGGIEGIATFGEGLVRVTGPFSYISGMSAFLVASYLAGLGLYILGYRGRLFLLSLTCVLAAFPVTGSRSVLFVGAGATLMVVFVGWLSGLVRRRGLMSLLFTLSILAGLSLSLQDSVWSALKQRHEENAEEGISRIFSAFTNAFDHYEDAGMFGFGTGAANYGALALAPSSVPFYWLPHGAEFEEEAGRIVLELGIMGWSLSMLLRLGVFLWSLYLALWGIKEEVKCAGVFALPFAAVAVQQGWGVFSAPYTSAAYWFSVGLLALAHKTHLRASPQ